MQPQREHVNKSPKKLACCLRVAYGECAGCAGGKVVVVMGVCKQVSGTARESVEQLAVLAGGVLPPGCVRSECGLAT